jgi:hypothetical protein
VVIKWQPVDMDKKVNFDSKIYWFLPAESETGYYLIDLKFE